MSFTLTTLKSSIEEYTQNTNWGSTTDQMNTIIRQAEERINYAVQIANFNTKSAASVITAPAAVVAIADSETGPIAPIYFRIQSSVGTPANNAWSYLLLKDYNFLQEYAPVDSATGTPKYYAFYNDAQDVSPSNAATFSFAPIPSGNLNCEILYFFEPASLVTVDAALPNDLTWLSTHGTNALLYACLVEAYTFLKGEQDLMQLYDTKYKEALQTLIMTEQGNYRTSFRDRQRAA